MSNRSLIELNHDYRPSGHDDLVKWANAMRAYMGSGDPNDLPSGITWLEMRHHSEPSKFQKHQEPAEPSGNTGELPVCRKCNGTKRVMFDQVGEEWKVRPATGLENGARCPDCSAAQPATEQPRIWRILDLNGVPFATQTTSRATAWHWYRQPDVSGIQFSTDNGKTWIDEQAEREGK